MSTVIGSLKAAAALGLVVAVVYASYEFGYWFSAAAVSLVAGS